MDHYIVLIVSISYILTLRRIYTTDTAYSYRKQKQTRRSFDVIRLRARYDNR